MRRVFTSGPGDQVSIYIYNITCIVHICQCINLTRLVDIISSEIPSANDGAKNQPEEKSRRKR